MMNDLAMKDLSMKDEETLSSSPSPLLASPSSPYCGKRLPKAGEEDEGWNDEGFSDSMEIGLKTGMTLTLTLTLRLRNLEWKSWGKSKLIIWEDGIAVAETY